MKCRICGSENVALEVTAREMMIPTRDEFDYFECADCHCLQIKDIPENLGSYYGDDYYSYTEVEYVEVSNVEKNMTPILDVGCGAGEFLNKIHARGYCNLTGCDPFIPQDIIYSDEIKIYKKTIHEMEGQYKYIYLNDSYEHVTDPHEVMESIKRLLSPDGACYIKIPVYPNIAFDTFGADWYQLDAPRHIYLHSVMSLNYLAKKHGLYIGDIKYDSLPDQMFRSYLYSQDIPFWEQNISDVIRLLGQDEVDEIRKLSKEANDKGYGDHAAFYIYHKN